MAPLPVATFCENANSTALLEDGALTGSFANHAPPPHPTVPLAWQIDGRFDVNADGLPEPFHVYSMRQAIEEGFILDVLRGYQTYKAAFEIEQRGRVQTFTTFRPPTTFLINEEQSGRDRSRGVEWETSFEPAAGWQIHGSLTVNDVVVTVIGSLRSFDMVSIMTSGGPYGSSRVLAYYMYEQALSEYGYRMGYGTAIATVLFAIMLFYILFVLYRIYQQEKDTA